MRTPQQEKRRPAIRSRRGWLGEEQKRSSPQQEKRRLATRSRRGWLGATVWWLALALVLGACSSLDRACEEHEECEWGFFCRNDGLCKPGCRHTIECAKGEVCQGHTCIKARSDEDEDGFPLPLDCDDKDRLVHPAARELCGNNKDDDCNSLIDEEGCVHLDCQPGQSRPCYDGKSSDRLAPAAPCRKGTQRCNSKGVWADCQGQLLPTTEICDNVDNDCDGKVDEEPQGKPLSRSCYPGEASTRGIGACQDGLQKCNKGKWGPCQGMTGPATEVCDGKDNDCNGQIDDVQQAKQPCQTGKPGLCASGEKRCHEGKLVCVGLKKPGTEVCGDNKDNDCDGVVDNGCPYQATSLGRFALYPQHLALSSSYAVVGLKESKKLAVLDLGPTPPARKADIPLAAAPQGLFWVKDRIYVLAGRTLYQATPGQTTTTQLVQLPRQGEGGALRIRGSWALTRLWEPYDPGSGPTHRLSLCRVELQSGALRCEEILSSAKASPPALALWGQEALLLSQQGLHFVDILSLKEDKNRRLALGPAPLALAVDEQKNIALVTDSQSQKVHLIPLNQPKQRTTLTIHDPAGDQQTPGEVAAKDGFAYVAHSRGRYLSLIDLAQQKEVRQIKVGLWPQGIALGPASPSKGRRALVACPGDNTVWTFQTKP